MMDFIEQLSESLVVRLLGLAAPLAVSYHFTDSFIVVLIIMGIYIALSNIFPIVGGTAQWILMIVGAVFMFTDGYPTWMVVLYLAICVISISGMLIRMFRSKNG